MPSLGDWQHMFTGILQQSCLLPYYQGLWEGTEGLWDSTHVRRRECTEGKFWNLTYYNVVTVAVYPSVQFYALVPVSTFYEKRSFLKGKIWWCLDDAPMWHRTGSTGSHTLVHTEKVIIWSYIQIHLYVEVSINTLCLAKWVLENYLVFIWIVTFSL